MTELKVGQRWVDSEGTEVRVVKVGDNSVTLSTVITTEWDLSKNSFLADAKYIGGSRGRKVGVKNAAKAEEVACV